MPVGTDTLDVETLMLPPYDPHSFSLLDDDLFETPVQEIWKKFEILENVPISEFEIYMTSNNPLMGALKCDDNDPVLDAFDYKDTNGSKDNATKSRPNEIRNHDCMWAGHCASKDHKQPAFKSSGPLNISVPTTTVSTTRRSNNAQTSSSAGRSLLLNSRNNQQQQMRNNIKHDHSFSMKMSDPKLRYETPEVSSEDDSMDSNNPHQLQQIVDYITTEKQTVIQILNEALTEMPDDSDLSDYLRDVSGDLSKTSVADVASSSGASSGSESSDDGGDEDDANNANTESLKITTDHAYYRSPEIDHCYYISKDSSRRFENLGVDTPSDSEEEEIDVVNVHGDTHQMLRNHQKAPLPTNPSPYDRQSLQRSIGTAINKRQAANSAPGKGRPPSTFSRQTATSNSNQNTKEQQTQQQSPQPRVNKKRSATTTENNRTGGTNNNTKGVKRARQSYRQRRKRGSGDSDSDCDSDKRNLHNDMERQRRVDLRNAFDDLRVLLPTVCHKERAAKVNILRDAAEFCKKISQIEDSLKQTKLELKRHQDVLMARVSQLRRQLAANR